MDSLTKVQKRIRRIQRNNMSADIAERMRNYRGETAASDGTAHFPLVPVMIAVLGFFSVFFWGTSYSIGDLYNISDADNVMSFAASVMSLISLGLFFSESVSFIAYLSAGKRISRYAAFALSEIILASAAAAWVFDTVKKYRYRFVSDIPADRYDGIICEWAGNIFVNTLIPTALFIILADVLLWMKNRGYWTSAVKTLSLTVLSVILFGVSDVLSEEGMSGFPLRMFTVSAAHTAAFCAFDIIILSIADEIYSEKEKRSPAYKIFAVSSAACAAVSLFAINAYCNVYISDSKAYSDMIYDHSFMDTDNRLMTAGCPLTALTVILVSEIIYMRSEQISRE